MRANVRVQSRRLPHATTLAALVMLALAGCGGGGGSGGGGAISSPAPTTPPPVSTPNAAPTISGAPPTTAVEGSAYSFQPAAADSNGDSLTFSAIGLPGWLVINSSTGAVSGSVPAGAAGTYGGIVITVSDGKASASLQAFSITVSASSTAPSPSVGAAELQWTAPTKNEDGTALTNLAGYKVRYGTSPGALTQVLDVASAAQTSVTVNGLAAGTWYFTVASYTNTGAESAQTGAVWKTIS